jgi:hypothetical protein
MSGNPASETAKDRLAKFEAILDEYLLSIGLDKIQYSNYAFDIINKPYTLLEKMTESECGEACFTLRQYVLYLQKEKNRNNVRLKWANTELLRLLAASAGKYGDTFVKFDEKTARLAYDNVAAGVLMNIVTHATARMTEVEGITTQINLIADTLRDLQSAKRGERYDAIRKN